MLVKSLLSVPHDVGREPASCQHAVVLPPMSSPRERPGMLRFSSFFSYSFSLFSNKGPSSFQETKSEEQLYSTHSKNLKEVKLSVEPGAYVRDTGLNVVQIS